jgi:2,3-bisphosphoglycerate-dependent phosphoglycerate mutase
MLVLIRHCSALGQARDAELSEMGIVQSQNLALQISKFFNVTRIISSPFKRAIDTVKPLAAKFNLDVECDELLRERYFCDNDVSLLDKLKHSFIDYDYKACEDGESNTECQKRAQTFLQSLHKSTGVTVVVAHGNIIATLLALNSAKIPFGFDEMCALTNPDVFVLNFDFEGRQLISFDRIWNASEERIDSSDRISARAVILDPSRSRVLLFHLHNKDVISKGEAAKSLWITPGGGVEPGEDLLLSLERELEEELGIMPSSYTVKGHLWRSTPKPMVYKNKPFMFIDNYFLVQLNSDSDTFDFSKWTDEEKTVLTKLKWWNWEELRGTTDLVVPPQLKSFRIDVLDGPIELITIEEDI